MSEKKKSKKTLSKSAFIRGQQCLKSLYLYKNRYFLRDPIPYDQQLKFRRGHHIGELAHKLFPGGVNLSPGHPSRQKKAAEETRIAIEQKTPVIYEAVFMTEEYVAIMDILVLVGNEYHAWEVKSSLRISETYINDISFQYFVMSAAGFKPEKAGIIYVNKDYVLEDDIDPDALFLKEDLTDEIRSRQNIIAELAPESYNVMFADSSPEIEVGLHCFSPYPCEFYSHCHKKILKSPLLKLAGLSTEEKYSLLNSETDQIEQCHFEDDFLRKQCEVLSTGKSIFDDDLLAELFEMVYTENPPLFMHILSVQKSLPEHKGDRPYMRKPYAAALADSSDEYYEDFSMSDTPLKDLLSFITKNTNEQQIIILDDEELLPDDLIEKLDDIGVELVNIHPWFLRGIWVSKDFSPDYSGKTIRNSVMKDRPRYFDRLALLLDIDKGKIDDPANAGKNYVVENLRSLQGVFARLYEAFA
ncbi:MAG: hypothetical protein C0592_08845 [Marinilabiliales bacterium]|nr:MAG: hypothetical protein C0592_08845 [Marinilabiliales bacterium]